MSGSGEVEVVRLVRRLRVRVAHPDTHPGSYGNHMACSMALGLVFMGGGR